MVEVRGVGGGLSAVWFCKCYLKHAVWLCSAWIAEDQIWPYVKFKSKFMITQKVPQSFTEAVNDLEEELQGSGDAAVKDVIITFLTFCSCEVVFTYFNYFMFLCAICSPHSNICGG